MRTAGSVCVAALALGVWSSPAGAANSVIVSAQRLDDFLFPLDTFAVGVDVDIPDVAGVTGVTVTLGDGVVLVLEVDMDGASWSAEKGFVDLASMKLAITGAMTVNINGSSPSVSTFTFDATPLVDADFFQTATGLSPANGSTGVPVDVVFSWTDPTGAALPDALIVDTFGPLGTGQEDDSILGSLFVTDTSWAPLLALDPGPNELEVVYLNVDQAGLVGSIIVTSGVIVWGESPFAPPGYPVTTPLLVIGSSTIVGFDVSPACPTDINGDGVVNVIDLAELIGSWGACP